MTPKTKISLKNAEKMPGQALQILGVRVNSTSESLVLWFVRKKIASLEKFWISTPNPEFIVASQKDLEFREILNQADLAIPDGIGLVWASRFLGTVPQVKERVAGSDLVEKMIIEAQKTGWKIGVVGARRGDDDQTKEQLRRLTQKYHGLLIEKLHMGHKYQIVFACQGMKEQEHWIKQNLSKVNGQIFMGIGGSLDFLTGFSHRAPNRLRLLGLEWFWRLWQNPRKHLPRIFRAVVVFPWLVIRKKLSNKY